MLFHAAEFAQLLRDCHFMLQREVVDRMAAAPGSKVYGRLSVMLQYRFSGGEAVRRSGRCLPAGAEGGLGFRAAGAARVAAGAGARRASCSRQWWRRRSASGARPCATRCADLCERGASCRRWGSIRGCGRKTCRWRTFVRVANAVAARTRADVALLRARAGVSSRSCLGARLLDELDLVAVGVFDESDDGGAVLHRARPRASPCRRAS